MKTSHKIIALSVGLGLSVAFIDAVLDSLFFYRESYTFLEVLITRVPAHEIYIRTVILLAFVGFGFVIARIFSRQQVTEQALRHSEERYRGLFGGSPDPIFCADPESGIIIDANPAAERLLAYPREQLIGKHQSELHPHELAEDVRLAFAEHAKQGASPGPIETMALRADGTGVPVEIMARVIDIGGASMMLGHFRDVKERKQAEESLRRSEATLRSIFRAAPVGIGMVSDRVFQWINEGMEELTGYAGDELIGQSARMLYPSQEEFEKVGAVKYGEIRRVGRGAVETRWKRKDGQVLDVHLSSCPIDPSDLKTGVVFTAMDITERKSSEKLVRTERDRAQRYLDLAGIVFIAIDRARTVTMINRKGCDVLGYDEDEIVGRDWFENFLPARNRVQVAKTFESLIDGDLEPVEYYENSVVTKSGEERLVAWHNAILRDEAGNITGTLSAGEDITERRRAEDELNETKALLQAAIQQSPSGIIIADAPDVRIRMANTAALGIRGKSLVPLTDIPVDQHPTNWQTFYPNGQPYEPEALPLSRAILRGEVVQNVEVIIRRRTGEDRCVLANAAPVRDSEGRITAGVVVFTDITERKQAEEEKRRLEEQMWQTQKLESLGVLAGGIAHDFNNLMTGVLGNAELALDELSPVSPARASLDAIVSGAKRAAELSRQMLAYSGKGRFVVEPVNLNELIEEMAHLLTVSISKKVTLKYNFAEILPAVNVDATQIRQVIMNLITNASEAVEDKSGVVSISTGSMHCDSDYLSKIWLAEDLPDGEYVFVEVADTGGGMSTETVERIFDPFFTTKFTGRGLGLAAVLGIVRGHNGAIRVYSEPGKGSTFKIFLPAGEGPAPSRERSGEGERDWKGEGTVLVVDDDESVREVGQKMLERAGFAVLTASDGDEAMAIFRERAEEITCIILDLTMPQMNGEETFRELRSIKPKVCVILTSGYNEQEATNRFAGKGLAGFLQKPFRYVQLIEKLREILEPKEES